MIKYMNLKAEIKSKNEKNKKPNLTISEIKTKIQKLNLKSEAKADPQLRNLNSGAEFFNL